MAHVEYKYFSVALKDLNLKIEKVRERQRKKERGFVCKIKVELGDHRCQT